MPDPPHTLQSDVARLGRVVLAHARDAYAGPSTIAEQWRERGFLGAPDHVRACAESDAFARLLEELGAEVVWLDPAGAGLDSIYVRDASVVCDRGAVLCRMGKAARAAEPAAVGALYERLGISVLGEVRAPGTLEGGDVAWLGPRTVAVGQGYRTNAEGIRQLRALLGDSVDEVVTVPLPHWRGPGDVFHLMSMLSPLADDLAVVYSPLLPVPFRERLLAGGIQLVEVPEEEFDAMGCNVLAVAPRVAVALEGAPLTCRRMEEAGVRVHTYAGSEISVKGCGGPTCLTRPLERCTD